MRHLSRSLRLAALLLAACSQPPAPPDPATLPPPLVAPAAQVQVAVPPALAGVPAPLLAPPAASARPHPHELLLAHNATRAAAGLPPLTARGPLMLAAQWHADDMAGTGAFSHRGRDGSWPWDRVSRQSYNWSWASENIAWGYETTAALMDPRIGWLSSPGHRSNILSREATEIGFGLAYREGRLYAVVVFARPR